MSSLKTLAMVCKLLTGENWKVAGRKAGGHRPLTNRINFLEFMAKDPSLGQSTGQNFRLKNRKTYSMHLVWVCARSRTSHRPTLGSVAKMKLSWVRGHPGLAWSGGSPNGMLDTAQCVHLGQFLQSSRRSWLFLFTPLFAVLSYWYSVCRPTDSWEEITHVDRPFPGVSLGHLAVQLI